MDQYCIMGNPVEHSRSPWIHARFAELTQQALHYGRRLAPLDAFENAVTEFRADPAGDARGCNVTMPFKFEAATLAREHLSERAALAGAVNTLSFRKDGVYGDNSDGAGLVHDITHNAGVPLQGHDVLLIGAGGGSAGALGPLIKTGPRRLVVANRTLDKAVVLVQRHAALAARHRVELEAHSLDAAPGRYDVVINATATSLAGSGVPIGAQVLKQGALAVDMVYGAAAARFLDWAREHGAVPRDGLGMLVEQAAESFFVWRGVRPPSAQVLTELRAIVEAR